MLVIMRVQSGASGRPSSIGGGRGLAVAPSVRGDASLESFNSYHKRDRVNEWQREPGDHGAGWVGGRVCVDGYKILCVCVCRWV